MSTSSAVTGLVLAVVVAACGGKIQGEAAPDRGETADLPRGPQSSTDRTYPPTPERAESPPAPSSKPSELAPTCSSLRLRTAPPVTRTCAEWSVTDKHPDITVYSDRRIVTTLAGSVERSVRATLGKKTGTAYFEAWVLALSNAPSGIGFANAAHPLTSGFGSATACGFTSNEEVRCPGEAVAPPLRVGAVLSVAADVSTHRAWFALDGQWVGCERGSTPTAFALPPGEVFPLATLSQPYTITGDSYRAAFAPNELAFDPPRGFEAGWCE